MNATTGKFMVIGWKDLKKVLAEISADILANDKEMMIEMILDGQGFPNFSNLAIVQVIGQAELIRDLLVESNPEVELFLLRDTSGDLHTLFIKDNDGMQELEDFTNANFLTLFKSKEEFVKDAEAEKAAKAEKEKVESGPERDERGRFKPAPHAIACSVCGNDPRRLV
jgi:hypothetical protein